VKSVVGPNNGQVNTTYDSMGRVWKQTNPFQSGGTPGAETVNTFDALGRTTQVTLPDNQTVQTSYSGNTVTVTDQVNRKMKREVDGLGRLVKVYEQTASGGTPTQETSYTYDLMDRLVEVNQGSQLRKYKYDDMGRLLFEKIPEQYSGPVNSDKKCASFKVDWGRHEKALYSSFQSQTRRRTSQRREDAFATGFRASGPSESTPSMARLGS
jgi:YD repeat-containing protein